MYMGKMDSSSLSFQNNGLKALPALYTDIINITLSFVHASEDPDDLLDLALVNKEWCQLSRRLWFAKLDDLNPSRLPALRAILDPGSEPSDKVQKETTFAKHVRRAILYIDLETDDWEEAKEMIMLMNRSFTTGFKLTVMMRSGVVYSSHLLDIKLCCENTTHLGLISVQLDMPKETLSEIICDHSWPWLSDMTLEKAVWKKGADTSAQGKKGRTLTLDHLHFLEGDDSRDSDRFWPHEDFETLVVKSLILRVDILSSSFWEGVPGMFKKIAGDVVEVDAAHELSFRDLTRAIKGLKFHKLRTLKLRIMQDTGYSGGRGLLLGDSETELRRFLGEMHLAALETLVISIADARDYITPDVPDKEGRPDFIKSGRLFDDPMDWSVVDEAISQLTQRPSRLSKVVMASWFEDWLKPNDDALISYLKKNFRCVHLMAWK